MNISIFGTGNMASGSATLSNGLAGTSLADAADKAETVVLAVPYEAAGGLDGKTVIDNINPLTADYSGLTIGHTISAAEEIKKAAPQAKVVEAFNTVFASVLQNGGKAAGQPVSVFVASDDAGARKDVAALAESAGFRPVEAGGLSAARYLEPFAGLNISLGYGLGHGTDITPTWQGIA